MAADPEVGYTADAVTNDNASGPSSQRNRKLSPKTRENEANKDLYENETITVGTKISKRTNRSTAAKTTLLGNSRNAASINDIVE